MADVTCEETNDSPVWDTWDVVRWKMPKRFGGGDHHLYTFKDTWVAHNKDTIKSAAEENRFAPLLMAGVCWIEVAGDPQFIDSVAHSVRSFDWMGPDWVDRNMTITRRPEKTSFGPISMQLRTAAQTLGMDIADMDYSARSKLGMCLEVDVYNINLAAKHLRDLLDVDGLQTDPPRLSDEALRVAATRYNRGSGLSLERIKENTSYGDLILKLRERLTKLIE